MEQKSPSSSSDLRLRLTIGVRHWTVTNLPESIPVAPGHLVRPTPVLPQNLFSDVQIRRIGDLNAEPFTVWPYFGLLFSIDSERSVFEHGNSLSEIYSNIVSRLWFLRDNAASVSIVTGFDDRTPEVVYSKVKLGAASNAEGEYPDVAFTVEEILKAAEIQRLIGTIATPSPPPAPLVLNRIPVITKTLFHLKKYNDNHRIDRALNFVNMARMEDFLPLKISLYVVVLECLFTTGKTEIQHKICERAAFYLGGSGKEKEATFELVKDAYEVRSGFFHGQLIKKNLVAFEQLKRVSVGIDALLRKLLLKVLYEDSELFLSKDDELDAFFRRLLFS